MRFFIARTKGQLAQSLPPFKANWVQNFSAQFNARVTGKQLCKTWMYRGSLIHCFLLPRSPFTFRITEVPSLWLLSSLTAWIILQICLWLHTTLELCAICAMLSELQNELQIKVADVAFKIHVLYQFCWLHSSQAKIFLVFFITFPCTLYTKETNLLMLWTQTYSVIFWENFLISQKNPCAV